MKMLLLFAVLGISCLALRVSAQPASSPSTPSSPLVADVLKLARAKVDENVMLAFVQASARRTPVSASDILELRAQGVSAQVQIALLNPGQHASEPAPQPAEFDATKTTTPPAGETIAAPPEPVAVSPTTEYLSVASPVYVPSSYYPYSCAYNDSYYGPGWGWGLGWGWGWGLSWWGWGSCYPYGYPWYGYGCGYSYAYSHCGYAYPACSSGHDGHHGHVTFTGDYHKANTFNSAVGATAGKTGVPANFAGSGRAAAGAHGVTASHAGSTTSMASGPQKVGQASVASVATRPGGVRSSQVIAGTASKPGVATQAGTVGQSVKPSLAGAARVGQSGSLTARPAPQGAVSRVAQSPGVRSTAVSAPNSASVSPRMPVRSSAVYAGAGARSYSGPTSFGSRPTGGFSGGYSGPSRSFSSPSMASHGFSGGASRGGFSGFSGSRGGGGGFSGGHGGGGGHR